MGIGKTKCVFGPLPSRRLGMSLGVDLLPFKTCSMDCVYCECGATTDLTMERREYVPTGRVLAEIDEAVAKGGRIDFVTFSGAGEPTLHSGIGRIVAHLKERHPSLKVCLLTNSTLLGDPQVASEISAVDLIVPSLDASDETEFAKVNRSAPGITLASIVEGMAKFKSISKAAMWLEIFIVAGVNDSMDSARRFASLVERIAPDKVQLNTLDRPGTEHWVGVPDAAILNDIAEIISCAAPVEIIGKAVQIPASGRSHPSVHQFNSQILALISRRPCTAEDMASSFNMDKAKVESHLRRMEKAGLVSEESGPRGTFYRPA